MTRTSLSMGMSSVEPTARTPVTVRLRTMQSRSTDFELVGQLPEPDRHVAQVHDDVPVPGFGIL
jgi:hypothetical protein